MHPVRDAVGEDDVEFWNFPSQSPLRVFILSPTPLFLKDVSDMVFNLRVLMFRNPDD